jgi:hypothetical protein
MLHAILALEADQPDSYTPAPFFDRFRGDR